MAAAAALPNPLLPKFLVGEDRKPSPILHCDNYDTVNTQKPEWKLLRAYHVTILPWTYASVIFSGIQMDTTFLILNHFHFNIFYDSIILKFQHSNLSVVDIFFHLVKNI